MKRAGPEERDELPPLFALAEREAAANRAEVGMARAADRATRLDDSWRAAALAQVRAMAEVRTHFLAEDCGIHVPAGSDPRAVGAVLRDAVRAGFVVRDGYAPANSSNRAPKSRWKSLLVHVPAGEPAKS